MNANELRIGNYAIYGGNITQMNVGEFIHFVRFPEVYEPILLTPDWLMKLGFEQNSGNLSKGRFHYHQSCFISIEGFNYDYNGITVNPEYVHQLQNIYFAITGEELQLQNT